MKDKWDDLIYNQGTFFFLHPCRPGLAFFYDLKSPYMSNMAHAPLSSPNSYLRSAAVGLAATMCDYLYMPFAHASLLIRLI